jgi:predicted metal-dependent phosphoesterase TrpH
MGGIVIWAHPFRYDRSIPTWLEDVLLDGIEVASTTMAGEASSLAIEIARAHGIAQLKNSDAHIADSIGMYKNKSPYHLGNNADLIEYVRKAH